MRGIIVVDEPELARLPGAIESYRAALALVRGDPAAIVVHAELAIARAAEGDHVVVASAAALSGLASWGLGDLESAHRGYSTAVDGLRRAGHISDVLGCSITLADIRITQGRLGDAVRTYDDALQLAAAHEVDGVMRGTPDMLVGLSQVALERNDLEAAASYLARAEELGEQLGLPQHPYRLRLARSRMREVDGDLAGALALLDEAERVYVGDFSPNVRPIPAMRARLLVKQGRLSEALDWARDNHLSADDDLSYVREYEHVTLARILLAQHAADGLLERLEVAAEDGGRTGTLIEVLVLQALAHAEAGDAALDPLERALRLAEPEGYVRVFVDEGAPLRALLATTRAEAADVVVPPSPPPGVRRSGDCPGADGTGRPAQCPRARRAAAPRLRPRRPGHRARARRVAQHRAHAHEEHLRQARRQQPPRGRDPGGRARPAVPQPRLTLPKITTPLTTSCDVRSPRRLLACRHEHHTIHQSPGRVRLVRDPPAGAARSPMVRPVRGHDPDHR